MPGGRPRKSVETHIAQGTYRRDRHGPRPKAVAEPSAIWDTFLALPDTPPTSATLPQEEREAIALAQMGWKLPR